MAARENTKDVVLFILGAAAGAALGLLLAPRPGTETREQLADWLKERREKSSDFFQRVKEKLPEKKEAIAAAFKNAKEALFESKEEVGV